MKTPNYYKGVQYGMEAHEVIEDFVGDNYNMGVAVAYLLRAGKKPDNDIVQDLNKKTREFKKTINKSCLKYIKSVH